MMIALLRHRYIWRRDALTPQTDMCIKAVIVCAEASSFLDFVEAGRGKMQAVTLILLAVMVSVALAG